jgi:hypothetical protein
MYYHIKLKYNIVNESGKNVTKNEEYLVQNCEFHAEAETKGYEHASTYGFENADVTSVKRSKIRELVNENPKEEEIILYDAVIADVFVDENSGKEKELHYHVGVYATSVKDATNKVQEYMRQGISDMRFIAVKETKIVEIL